MGKIFHPEFAAEGILRVVVDLPDSQINVINDLLINELEQLIEELKQDKNIQALILQSAKKRDFLSGEDINRAYRIKSSEEGYQQCRRNQDLMDKWAQLPFPTLAMIHGRCMGAGSEWALACDYRICSDDSGTLIGFPEVKLGLLPSWGGTVRLPELIGVKNALKLVLGGNSINAGQAWQYCLVDKVVPARRRQPLAVAFMRQILDEGDREVLARRKKNPARKGYLERRTAGRSRLQKLTARKIRKQINPRYPAPLENLRSVIFASNNDFQDALSFEARKYAVLVSSEAAKNLMWIYSIRESIRWSTGVSDPAISGESIDKIGVIGAGKTGRGISALAIANDHPLRLKDIENRSILNSMAYIRGQLSGGLRNLDGRALENKMDLLRPTIRDYSGLLKADLVVETVNEDLDLKSAILQKVDDHAPGAACIVSTSAILSVAELAVNIQAPERFLGLHLFEPIDKIPFAEILRGPDTADDAVATLFNLLKHWGKFPVVVNDHPGGLVNRLEAAYLLGALLLLESGQPIREIDRAMVDFGMRCGPFEQIDRIGILHLMRLAELLRSYAPSRFPKSYLLGEMMRLNRNGREFGRGFYTWKTPDKGRLDRRIYKDLELKPRASLPVSEIQERLILQMINEAVVCLDEKVAQKPADIDAATVLGLEFPAFRGGLLRYADSLGIEKVCGKLTLLAENAGIQFTPARLLGEIRETGSDFYSFFENSAVEKESSQP